MIYECPRKRKIFGRLKTDHTLLQIHYLISIKTSKMPYFFFNNRSQWVIRNVKFDTLRAFKTELMHALRWCSVIFEFHQSQHNIPLKMSSFLYRCSCYCQFSSTYCKPLTLARARNKIGYSHIFSVLSNQNERVSSRLRPTTRHV